MSPKELIEQVANGTSVVDLPMVEGQDPPREVRKLHADMQRLMDKATTAARMGKWTLWGDVHLQIRRKAEEAIVCYEKKFRVSYDEGISRLTAVGGN